VSQLNRQDVNRIERLWQKVETGLIIDRKDSIVLPYMVRVWLEQKFRSPSKKIRLSGG